MLTQIGRLLRRDAGYPLESFCRLLRRDGQVQLRISDL